jgi:flagellar hook-basal body complex protein FliE
MKIGAINSISSSFTKETQSKKSTGFKDVLGSFVENVNASEKKAQELTEDFVLGKGVPIHEVMIAGEKAKTNLELLVEIRNKAIETYKELTKMQI